MMASQWLGLALLVAVFAGLTYVYVRHGVKIRADPENKPPNPNVP
jgi:uncharacterized membrane protein